MKKVAIFGNAGGGKSTLARRLADVTGLPLYAVDQMKYRAGGLDVPHEEYLKAHREILQQQEWIIDGFGCVPSAWERFGQADTLIYLDLPLFLHGLWVTKRLLKGGFIPPEGWPENSPLWKSSLNSYRVLWLCHQKLTPKYRQFVEEAGATKRVYHLRSAQEIRTFLASL